MRERDHILTVSKYTLKPQALLARHEIGETRQFAGSLLYYIV